MTVEGRPGGGVDETDDLPSIETLDDAYLARQDRVADALAVGDRDAASLAAEAAGSLRSIDADGLIWRVMGPLPSAEPLPHYRYRYRHQRSTDGERFHHADGSRFARHPSLAAAYAERIPGGWLRTAVRGVEPAGYAATLMVAAGLWLLLGDLIGSLPGIAVLAAMALAAAGLWWASVALDGVPYREAARLSQLTRLTAIGVTGAVAWVSTIEAETVTTATRVLLCSAVVFVAAVGSFALRRGVDTWAIAVGSWPVTVISAAIVLAEIAYEAPDEAASAQLGALVAAAIGFPLVTVTARLRWIPFAIPYLALMAGWALFGTMVDSPRDLHTVLVVAGGIGATASVWLSRNAIHRSLRGIHRASAYVLAVLTALVAAAQGPWDAFLDWLGDVPLPVVLVIGGSIVLVVVGLVVRAAVARLGDVD